MATALTRNVLRMPGRLVMYPTNLSAAYPYGGTEMGITRDAEFRFGAKRHVVLAEEWGNIPSEIVEGGSYAVFACVLREFDNDIVNRVFINTAAGTKSGDRVISAGIPQANQPGFRIATTQGHSFLFCPKSENTHPFVLMYNAVPSVNEDAMVQMSLAEEVGIAVSFICLPDYILAGGDGRIYQIGKKDDLTL